MAVRESFSLYVGAMLAFVCSQTQILHFGRKTSVFYMSCKLKYDEVLQDCVTLHYVLFSKYLNSRLIASRQRKRKKESAKVWKKENI
jgi:hypothetical protein